MFDWITVKKANIKKKRKKIMKGNRSLYIKLGACDLALTFTVTFILWLLDSLC
jgi:hypothetical protein